MSEQTSHSLFPAYASTTSSDASTSNKAEKKDWLTNESFTKETFQVLLEQKISYEAPNLEKQTLSEELPLEEDKKHESRPKKTKSSSKQSKEKDDILENLFPSQQHLNKAIFLEEVGLPCERAFRVDKKYDPENFMFGKQDSKTIPKYHCRTIPPVGLSKRKLAQWIHPKHATSKLSGRYFSKGSIKRLRTVPSKVQLLEETATLPAFIPFSKNQIQSIQPASSMINFDGISSDWKSHFNNSLKTSVSKDESVQVGDYELQEKVVNFNSALTENPHDEQLWLDFVAFQHELFVSGYEKTGSATESLLYEKQIAILDKALKHNPNSVQLSVAKLEVMKNSEEKEKLMRLWENLMFYHPNDSVAWKHYFQFVLSDISYFTVPRITKMFSKCVGTLANILEGKIKSHRVTFELMPNLLDVFGSLCSVFQSFGHREFALGLFQALVEFNLFAPTYVSDIHLNEEKIACFEPFWDCGAPRIGEENALGWANTVKSKIIAPNPTASILGLESFEDEILQRKLPLWQMWIEFELLRGRTYWLPWRPDTSLDQETEDLDDPNRTVSFEQISVFLVRITDEQAKFWLICEFLSFLGVRLHDAECPFFIKKHEHSLLVLEDFSQVYEYIKDIFPQHKVPEILKLNCSQNQDLYSSFIENVFKQSIDTFSDTYKSLLSFVWFKHHLRSSDLNSGTKTSKNRAGKLKKFCKNLLKNPENRNCLFLWSEYIHMDWMSGEEKKADQTFETLLVSTTAEEVVSYEQVWYFVRKHVECLLGIHSFYRTSFVNNSNEVLWIFSGLAQKTQYVLYDSTKKLNPSTVVRVSSYFKALLDRELKELHCEENSTCKCLNPLSHPLLDYLSCFALFLYIVKGLDSALEQYSHVKAVLKDKTKEAPAHCLKYLEEQIMVHEASLLNFHCWSCSQSLKPLQDYLFGAIERFPGNVKFLHLLLKIKTAAPVIGPTRRFFYNLVKRNKQLTPVTWLFAIISELLICFSIKKAFSWNMNNSCEEDETSLVSDCGLVWKVRYLFESALQSPSSRHCIALWRSHVKYEITVGEKSKAKAVLHQAFQRCSWVKALYLDGVQYFPEDLKYFLEMMNEKQMRVHTPLEELELLTLSLQQTEKDEEEMSCT